MTHDLLIVVGAAVAGKFEEMLKLRFFGPPRRVPSD
jgi:hypothetical protein